MRETFREGRVILSHVVHIPTVKLSHGHPPMPNANAAPEILDGAPKGFQQGFAPTTLLSFAHNKLNI